MNLSVLFACSMYIVVGSMLIIPNCSFAENSAEAIFTHIYGTNGWQNPESVSGGGSTLQHTITLREKLLELVNNLQINSLLDAPCGDYNWMKTVNLGNVHYIGIDIVKPLIEKNQAQFGNYNHVFKHLNLITDSLPQVDLILCRDLLAHLPFKDIFETLRNFKKSGSKYLLATTYPNKTNDHDISIGDTRWLDLEKHPFNFPKPLLIISENCTENAGSTDKSLGLWLLQDLAI